MQNKVLLFLIPWLAGVAFLFLAFLAGDAAILFLVLSVVSFVIGFGINKMLKKEAKKNKAYNAERLAKQKEKAEEEEILAYCRGLDKYSKQIDYNISHINESAALLRNLAPKMVSSVELEDEIDWAVHGGIADGLAGPGAGVATAARVMQENAQIRKRNEERIELANAQKRELNQIADGAPEQINKIISDKVRFMNEHRASYTQSIDDLFAMIDILNKSISKDKDTGVITVSVEWKQNKTGVHIDGALRAKLYSNTNEFVGYAYLVFPANGTSEGEGVLSGLCVSPLLATNYNIVIEPVKLWEIKKKGKSDEDNEKEKRYTNKYEKKFREEKEEYLVKLEKFEAEKLAQEEKREVKKQQNKETGKGAVKGFVVLLVIVGVIGIAGLAYYGYYIDNINPKRDYEKAVELIEQANYDEAREILEHLVNNDYPGAKETLVEMEKEENYKKGLEAIEAGEYSTAKDFFRKAGDGYKQSSVYIKYLEAVYRLDGKDLLDAEDELRELPADFLNVSELLTFIENNKVWKDRIYVEDGRRKEKCRILFYLDKEGIYVMVSETIMSSVERYSFDDVITSENITLKSFRDEYTNIKLTETKLEYYDTHHKSQHVYYVEE